MHKFRVFYQNNKMLIWKAVGIVLLILVLIHLANNFIKNTKETNTQEIATVNTTEPEYKDSQAIGSNKNVSTKELKKDTEIINSFISLCNEKKIEEAYNMLSADCKELEFKTIQDFYNNYYLDIFNENKSYDLETWFSSTNITYKIKMYENILASGSVNDEFIEDYYTVISEGTEKKININSFVGKKELNKEKTIEDIKFKILEQYMYIDYEEYKIEIQNNTNTNIQIDTKENTETVFLKDTNGVRYTWYGHEIANENLKLEEGKSITLNIKFNKLYNPKRKNNSICFTDIIKIQDSKKLQVEIVI